MARMLIGTRIRERREASGLKQADLARQAGISPSYLNLIEHNRRGIAGKVLLAIAEVLAVDISHLTEGADSDLVRDLQTAASASQDSVEVDRVEELISRFPGWARLIATLQRQGDQFAHSIEALSDRLTHDPFLAENLHEMLSSVTAIRATSSILTQVDAMEPLQQRRFQTNIFEESSRLSDLSQAMVNYFDRLSESGQSATTPQDEVEAFLASHRYHFAALEAGGDGDIDTLESDAPTLASFASRQLAQTLLAQYETDVSAMPLAGFMAAAIACNCQPGQLARDFNVSLEAVYRRLAFLPSSDALPDFGLITCDGTGAVLLRKPLPGFALPRYGAACALWPLYQAMTRPHAPVTAILQTPEERMFQAEALATYQKGEAPYWVQAVRTSMIFSAIRQEDATRAGGSILPVGLSCRICARDHCTARREPSIHARPT